MKQKRKKKTSSGAVRQKNTRQSGAPKQTSKKQSGAVKRTNNKQPRTFKWYLDKILMAAVGGLVITGIALWGVGTTYEMSLIGVIMLPATGILITPNIVMYAIKDSKDQKGSSIAKEKQKLHREPFFYKVNMPPGYHSKLIFGVVREALWSLFKLMIVVGILFLVLFGGFDGINSSDQIGAFLLLIGVMVGGIPVIAYNMACSVYRIIMVIRRKYTAYHAVVGGADGTDIWIMGENEKYNNAIYQFHYCRCLGIRTKKVDNTEAVLVFVPDEMYLLPFKEGEPNANDEREKRKRA